MLVANKSRRNPNSILESAACSEMRADLCRRLVFQDIILTNPRPDHMLLYIKLGRVMGRLTKERRDGETYMYTVKSSWWLWWKKQGEEEFVSFVFPVHRWVTYIIFSFNYMIIYVSKSKNNDLFNVKKYLTC